MFPLTFVSDYLQVFSSLKNSDIGRFLHFDAGFFLALLNPPTQIYCI